MADERLDFRDPAWVAERLGIDEGVVQQYLDQGRLPGVRLGDRWLISESTLAQQLKREERGQTEHRRLATLQGEAVTRDDLRGLPLSDRARRSIQLALQESVTRGNDYVGQEHLLLAIAQDPECTGARVLARLGFDARAAVEETLSSGDFPAAAERGLTPRGIAMIDHAARESRERRDPQIGTEHMLLGMAQVGLDLLRDQGIDADRISTALAEVREARSPAPASE